MIVKCSECAREVSDRAPACPGCGAPIVALAPSSVAPGAPPAVAPAAKPMLIEKTGKRYKRAQLIGGLLFVAGGIGSCAGMAMSEAPGKSLALLGIGMVIHLYGRAGAWWNHG